MASPNDPRAPQNWRDKYLALTDEQDALKQQHRKLAALLTRALLRLSVLSDGIDERLDACIGGLRRALRSQTTTLEQLTEVVDTLDGRIKVIAEQKSKKPVHLIKLIRTLVDQLKKVKVQEHTLAQLNLCQTSAKLADDSPEALAKLLTTLINVQAAVLSDAQNGGKAPEPFWRRWFSSSTTPSAQPDAEPTKFPSSEEQATTFSSQTIEGEVMLASELEIDSDDKPLDQTQSNAQPMRDYAKEVVGREEPPFATINPAICVVLDELIRQIEPPASAKENYQEARRLLDKGLNWFELVPLLENLSLVIVSAIDSSQQEFEAYLTLLNERLQQAGEALLRSDQLNGERRKSSAQMQSSVNMSLDDLRNDVANAHDLSLLKAQVNSRIDAMVGAMSTFVDSEKQHDVPLGDQLNALVEKVREMEEQSQKTEERIEEQRQLALRDVLTQLPNREAYNQRTEQEFDRWQRYQRPMVLAVADVDFFKRINDGFGHLAGDKVLRVIAKMLRKRLRKSDFVARFGGEEFVIILPETTVEQAIPILDGVRLAIANCPFHFREKPVSITLSFGVAEPTKGETPEQVFQRADKALYAAKNNGRNRIERS
jgi:diguanylate cyclase